MKWRPHAVEVCPLIVKLRDWLKKVGAASREAVAQPTRLATSV